MTKNQPIKIGLLADVQGEFSAVGSLLLHGAQLAVEEINAVGGINGRKIELIHLDPNMDLGRYKEFTQRLIEEDKVDVVFGALLSNMRETVRAVVNKSDVMYFYTNLYEGGVCDASMVGMGAVPEQQLSPLVPWMIEKFGKKVYTIAIDNKFGRTSTAWTRSLVEKQGGEILGEDFFAIGASEFNPTIERMKKTSPDWIMNITAGKSQDAFFPQAQAAGLNLPQASNEKIMLTFDHKRLPMPLLDRMYVTTNWVEEMDTPAVNAFKKRWRAKFPSELYISAMGYNTYNAVYMYKAIVEKAGSTKKADLRSIIASGGATIDAPAGKISIDPKSQHTTQQILLFAADAEHAVHEIEDFGLVEPYWLSEIGCDLTKADPKEQYFPDKLPQR
jgi:branched-chain amino acid transport system substrate-binding protein